MLEPVYYLLLPSLTVGVQPSHLMADQQGNAWASSDGCPTDTPVIALVQGLFLAYMMQRSKSILSPIISHAGMDIPIFLVYLSYVTG